ncbi:AsmA family protein [Balneolaceae bacterium YR4-1]|uniref:AsmA family protein n=1 Tax=Halalkalibaculum roseum TaxID=2709311 RepID=A0A6M1SXA8_9BACT|nr:AsmA-like C-terminal region-containing protein [Halalkalibaculum roseum]NGP75734.1 AsmA family protein [Halalkalibaculum roseum]
MKTFLRIAGGILAFLLLVILGLNIYFTDARLQKTVMPYVNEAVGRDVQVESMSLTFFSTFPQPGLSISRMSVPGESPDDTLMSLDELVVGVKLFSLFGNEISINEIILDNPKFTYQVYPDSTTNIDFLFETETEDDTTASGYAVNIPYFEVINGQFGYVDETSATDLRFQDLNATISLRYAELIESTVDLELGGLSATVDNTSYARGLPLSLSQTSTIDLEKEIVNLSSGTFSIRGLALDLSGSISDWSNTTSVDLNFNTSSDNFGELLRLVPAQYQEQVEELETRGSLAMQGTINGALNSEQLPRFSASIMVENGYLKNPDLPQAIENIQLNAKASNDELTIENLNAKAGSNAISGSGNLQKPLEENGAFSFDIKSDVDLATISSFYDIGQFDIEDMSGQMNLNATGQGNRAKPEAATFNADLRLSNGTLKYSGVPKAIQDINVDAKANQDLVTINRFDLAAAPNTFSMKGSVRQPLQEANRTINLDTNLRFDLASLKDFYPISEDTLEMNGILTAQATLDGKADQIERSVKSGSITLKNGFLFYKPLGNPLRDITFESVLEGAKMTIVEASFRSGENNLKMGGLITNYLGEDRSIDLKLEGFAMLNQITNYYNLEPTINRLDGTARVNLRTQGRPDTPAEMAFNGSLNIDNMNMDGEDFVHPITDLNGVMRLTPSSANLDSLSFNFGNSDMLLSGSLENYREYLKEKSDRNTTPLLKGSYYSQFLHVDEIIDWSDTTGADEPVLIELPDLNSSVTANIDRMLITGVNIRNLKAQASTTPTQIELNEAAAEMFEGKATGSLTWDVPQPDSTMITFNGSLQGVRAERFFEEYKVLGKKSRIHEYISGAFSSDLQYYSALNRFLDPIIGTTKMDGNFGMTKSRLKNHPLQLRIASMLKAQELESVSLDEWESTYTVSDTVLTLKDLRLTSSDVGLELNGTQHLVSQQVNYQMKLLLPPRFKKGISAILTTQATEALTQENGTIMMPLRVTGTLNNLNVKPDEEVIKPIIQKYLKDKAGNALKKIFGDG